MSASTSKSQPRTRGGKFAPKVPPLIYQTDSVLSAIELSQNPEALRLAGELAEANGTIEYIRKDNRVLQDALSESRKISQEREKQLAAKTRESVKWASKAETLAQEKQSLMGSLATEKSFCATYQKDAARFTGILGQMSATMGAIDWDTLPSAVGNLKEMLVESERECRELAKSFGAVEKKRDDLQGQLTSLQDAMSEALGANPEHNLIDRAEALWREVGALRAENNTLAVSLASAQDVLKLASTSVEVYRRDLGSVEAAYETLEASVAKWETAATRAGEELLATSSALDLAVADVQRLQPLLPLWARALFAFSLLAIVAAVAHQAGFQAGLGGAK